MGKKTVRPNYRRRVLRLPDLDHCKPAALNSLGSPASRPVYEYAINQFIAWYKGRPPKQTGAIAMERLVMRARIARADLYLLPVVSSSPAVNDCRGHSSMVDALVQIDDLQRGSYQS